MRPVAYIRRSARSRSDPGDVSREFQTAKVRELANGDAATMEIIAADWGKSAATDKTDKRLAFLSLLEEVERGEVSAIYAYSTDRLARSVEWAARLLNACRRAGTVIVTSEGRFEPDNHMTDQLFYFQAMSNESYSRQAEQKRRATVARLRERGDKLGPRYYGDLPGESADTVIAAFEESGSAHGAARLLNEWHTPSRSGAPWSHGTVRKILARAGKMPALRVRGAKARAPFLFYGLLRCHCGHRLTAVRQRYRTSKSRVGERVIYRCVVSSPDPNHGLKSIAQSKLLPAIRAEAARFQPYWTVERSAAADTERQALEAQRATLDDMYQVRGASWRDEWLRRNEEIDARLAELSMMATSAIDVQLIDWDGDVQHINRVLQTYWERTEEVVGEKRIVRGPIDLGPDLLPVRFHWRAGFAGYLD